MNEIHFDFEALLTLASFITGAIWFYAFFKKRKQQGQGKLFRIFDEIGSFFPVIFFVLIVRTFIFEPFRIPSSSMMPTLITGDFIYVNKFSYGFKLPVLHDTVIEMGKPKRGDIVVFSAPLDQSQDYIKRVVAIPGDRVFYDQRKKQLTINGKRIEQKFVEAYSGLVDSPDNRKMLNKIEYIEGREHRILTKNFSSVNQKMAYFDVTVPEGHYFALGDNRDNSADSRFWGFIPERNLVGEAKFIWMHWRTSDFFEGLKRIGTKLQ